MKSFPGLDEKGMNPFRPGEVEILSLDGLKNVGFHRLVGSPPQLFLFSANIARRIWSPIPPRV